MRRILQSNNGSSLVIVLMVIVVLGLLIPAGYTWYNKLFLNENRLVHQKQAVNLSVSAMETFKRQAQLTKVEYLTTHTYTSESPLTVMNGSEGMLDLYQFAEDEEGDRFKIEELQNHSGEYTVVVKGISGDLNHNQKKDSNEPYFYEHKMTAVETVAKGDVLIEKKQNDKVIETTWMEFDEFLDTYNNHPFAIVDDIWYGNCLSCNRVDGDVTIFDVGEREYYSDSIVIEATGSIKLEGSFDLQVKKHLLSIIYLRSQNGNISIHQSKLESRVRLFKAAVIAAWAQNGSIIVENASLSADHKVILAAKNQNSFALKDNEFPSMKNMRSYYNIRFWEALD